MGVLKLELNKTFNQILSQECLDPETRRERMKVKAEAWKSEKLCRKWEKLKTVIIYNNNFTEKQQVSNPYDEFLRAFEVSFCYFYCFIVSFEFDILYFI